LLAKASVQTHPCRLTHRFASKLPPTGFAQNQKQAEFSRQKSCLGPVLSYLLKPVLKARAEALHER